MPRVSVLMSNYNTPVEYLRKSLDSVLQQSFEDFEVMIVNDGSADGSKDVLYEYAAKDKRITVLENPQNLGLPRSLNRGLEACRGDYVARMDTDDICLPDRLEKQVAFMDANPDLILSGAWAEIFSTDESAPDEVWRPVMCPWEEHRIRLLFSNEPLLIHPTVIFRRELVERHGLRYPDDPKYRYTEDYKMWVTCSGCGPAGIMEDVVLKYRNAFSDSRITVRNADQMHKCGRAVQADQFAKLGIELTEDMYEYNSRLLNGRKPYDIKYKEWMDKIAAKNREVGLYSQEVMERLFRDRWFNIVYYGIAYEKSFAKKIKYFSTLYPGDKLKFIKAVISKNKP